MSLNLDKSDEDLKKEYEAAVVSGEKNQRKIITIFLTVILVVLISVPATIAYSLISRMLIFSVGFGLSARAMKKGGSKKSNNIN